MNSYIKSVNCQYRWLMDNNLKFQLIIYLLYLLMGYIRALLFWAETNIIDNSSYDMIKFNNFKWELLWKNT